MKQRGTQGIGARDGRMVAAEVTALINWLRSKGVPANMTGQLVRSTVSRAQVAADLVAWLRARPKA